MQRRSGLYQARSPGGGATLTPTGAGIRAALTKAAHERNRQLFDDYSAAEVAALLAMLESFIERIFSS
jgi:hypothetical protein